MNEFVGGLIDMLLSIPGILFTFTLKGYSQAFVAKKLGDPTPENQGRLTMNPVAHIDLIGFICILIFHFGWCKPIQTNSRYYKHIKRDSAIQILSGPAGLIVGGFIMSFFYVLFGILHSRFMDSSVLGDVLYYLAGVFQYATLYPLLFSVFYMLPLPGLDGYNLIANFLPYKYNRALYNIEKYSMFIFLAFILLMNYTQLSIIIYRPASWMFNLFTYPWVLLLAFLL